MIRIGIIGNAGRKGVSGQNLTKEIFEKTKIRVIDFIRKTLKKTGDKIVLVSGGSSWMDHVAVSLFEEWDFSNLILYLPSPFDFEKKEFCKNNYCGRGLNDLHKSFSKTVFGDENHSLSQISTLDPNNLIFSDGFFQRNSLIAKNCDILLAFTFGKEYPNPGGTLDTWKKFSGEKHHFPLLE